MCANYTHLTGAPINENVLFHAGFPIALSYPHFYLADPWLREEVEGSNPDPNLHETYFHINPVSKSTIEDS